MGHPRRSKPQRLDSFHSLFQPLVRHRQRKANEPLATLAESRAWRHHDTGFLDYALSERHRSIAFGNLGPDVKGRARLGAFESQAAYRVDHQIASLLIDGA